MVNFIKKNFTSLIFSTLFGIGSELLDVTPVDEVGLGHVDSPTGETRSQKGVTHLTGLCRGLGEVKVLYTRTQEVFPIPSPPSVDESIVSVPSTDGSSP